MQELDQLKAQIAELMQWKREREQQQLSFPVDDASKSALGVATYAGVGSTPKTQVYTDSGGDSLTGPRAYSQTVLIEINGSQYEFPSLI